MKEWANLIGMASVTILCLALAVFHIHTLAVIPYDLLFPAILSAVLLVAKIVIAWFAGHSAYLHWAQIMKKPPAP